MPYQHTTVKPAGDRIGGPGTAASPVGGIIAYLMNLITPAGGTVLDLFAGTGTTGVVAVREGFDAVLIERDPRHVKMIMGRLDGPIQQGLFGIAG